MCHKVFTSIATLLDMHHRFLYRRRIHVAPCDLAAQAKRRIVGDGAGPWKAKGRFFVETAGKGAVNRLLQILSNNQT